MIRFNFAISEKNRKIIDSLDKVIFEGFVEGFEEAMEIAEDAVKDFAPVLTGSLRNSISSGTNITARRMHGWVGSDKIYARIQEEGGTIRPRASRYLRFKVNGRWVFARQVRIPPQKYMERGIISRLDEIQSAIESVTVRTVKEK